MMMSLSWRQQRFLPLSAPVNLWWPRLGRPQEAAEPALSFPRGDDVVISPQPPSCPALEMTFPPGVPLAAAL